MYSLSFESLAIEDATPTEPVLSIAEIVHVFAHAWLFLQIHFLQHHTLIAYNSIESMH